MKSVAFLFGRQFEKRWTAVVRVGVVAVREIGGGGYGRTRDKWISGEGLKVRVGKPLQKTNKQRMVTKIAFVLRAQITAQEVHIHSIK